MGIGRIKPPENYSIFLPTLPGKRFIGGEPMKVATNVFIGFSKT
jgi:hypothetical protein